MARQFYDILTKKGSFLTTKTANLLLTTTADQDYFSDDGGRFEYTFTNSLEPIPAYYLLRFGSPQTERTEFELIVGGVVATDHTTPLNSFTVTTPADGGAVYFAGDGYVSFSQSAGARGYTDFAGADRNIAISVNGGNSSNLYGMNAARGLTVRGDAAAKIIVSLSGKILSTIDDYFYSNLGNTKAAAYFANSGLTVKKDFSGTLDTNFSSLTMSLAPGIYNLTESQAKFIQDSYHYYFNFGGFGLRSSDISIDGEMNSFADIKTSLNDINITLYDVTFTDEKDVTHIYTPSISGELGSIGIYADGDVTFGGVSGGSISTSATDVNIRKGKAKLSYNSTLKKYYLEVFDTQATATSAELSCRSLGIKGENIRSDSDFSPDIIEVDLKNVCWNSHAAGLYAENQISVAGNLTGRIDISASGVNTPMVSEIVSQTVQVYSSSSIGASGIIAKTIAVAGELSPEITINIRSCDFFNAFGIKATGIIADRINADINISIGSSSLFAQGTGIYALAGIAAASGTSAELGGNINISGTNSVGIMGFTSRAMNLKITGTIDARYAIVAGIRICLQDAVGDLGYDSQGPYKTYFVDDATHYLFNTNDTVELAAGASINGNIDLGDGQNIITIDSNATFRGRLESTLGTLRTHFRLNGEALSNAIVTLTDNCTLTESVGNITVNVDNAQTGTYKLINATGLGLSFGGQKIAVSFDNENYLLVVGGDAFVVSDSISVSADFVGGILTFTVMGLDNSRQVTGLAAAADTRENTITVGWDKFTADTTYRVDYQIMAEDDTPVSSGTVTTSDNRYVFTGINAGEYVVTTVTAVGHGDSTSGEFVTTAMAEVSQRQINVLSQQKLFDTSEHSLLYALYWNVESTEEEFLLLSHYEIQYIDNCAVDYVPTWEEADVVTKVSTDNSLIVSGLRDIDGFWWRVRSVDDNGNCGEWSRAKYVSVRYDATAPTVDRSSVTNASNFDVETGLITANLSWKLAEDESSGVDSYTLNVSGSLEFSYDIPQARLLSGDSISETLGNGVEINCHLSGETVVCEVVLPNGSYNWSLSVSDLYGNVNQNFAIGDDANGRNWIGDVTAPTFTSGIVAKSQRTYDKSTDSYYTLVTFAWGRAIDDHGDAAFDRYEIVGFDKNGDEYIIATVADIDAVSYSLAADEPGKYQWFVRVCDKFGNTAATDTSFYTVDLEAPTGEFYGFAKPVISARWDDYDTRMVYSDSGTWGGASSSATTVYENYRVSEVSVTLDFDAHFTDELSDVRYEIQLADNEKFINEGKYTTHTFTITAGDSDRHTLTLNDDPNDMGLAAGKLLGMDKIYYRVRVIDAAGNALEWHTYEKYEPDPDTGTLKKVLDYFKLEAPFASDSPADDKPSGMTAITDGSAPTAPSGLAWNKDIASWLRSSDAFGVKSYTVEFDNVKNTVDDRTYTVAANTNSISTAELAEGEYKWSVTATDYSGRTAKTDGKTIYGSTFIVDRTAPVFGGLTITVSGKDAILSWDKAEDNLAGVDYYVAVYGIENNLDASVVFERGKTSGRIYNDTFGDYEVRLYAVDKVGNASYISGTYTISESAFYPDTLADPQFVALSGDAPASATIAATIGGSNNSDYYRVDADGTGVLIWNVVSEAALGSNTGVNAALYDANGKKLSSAKVTASEANLFVPLAAGAGSNSDFSTLELKAVNNNNFMQTTVTAEREEALATSVSAVGALAYADTNVGEGDALDFKAFTLDCGALLNLGFSGTDNTGFTLYQLTEKTEKNNKTSYSLKSLKSATVRGTAGSLTASLNSLYLAPGTYYLGVKSNNAAKGGNSDYGISVFDRGDAVFDANGKAASLKFFTKGDNSDDWTDVKTAGAAGAVGDVGTITAPDTVIAEEWVGFGDAVDYKAFTLYTGAKLSFDVTATDEAKFSICRLEAKTDKKGVTTYAVKDVQTTKLSKPKNATTYSAVTKDQLLEAGTYYIKVESTNAKKGGDADYSVTLNGRSVFFTKGDNSDDWTDVKTAGPEGEVGNVGTITAPGTVIAEEWVGFGDTVDYKAFTLDDAVKLSFTVSATDAAKFSICRLEAKTDKKGVTTYSIKNVQTTTLSKPKNATVYSAVTKDQLLEAGTYYIKVESTNAKKGGNADYSVALNETSVFYTQASYGDNDWATAPELAAGDVSSAWVGFGDKTDYRTLTVDPDGGFYRFDLSGVEKDVKLTVYAVNAKTDKKGVTTYSLKSVKSVTATAKKPTVTTGDLCLNGETQYVLAIEAPGAAKAQNSSYTVAMTETGVFANRGNETWETADVLDSDVDGLLTTAAGGDKFDYFDLSAVGALAIDMAAGKVKLSFCNDQKKAVKTGCVYANGKSANLSSVTLVADNASTDTVTFGALDDSIRYLKIEAGTNGVNSYRLSLIA